MKYAFSIVAAAMTSCSISAQTLRSQQDHENFIISCTGPGGNFEIVQNAEKTTLHGKDFYGDKTISAGSFIFEFKDAVNYATAHCYQGAGIDSIETIGFEPSVENIRMDAKEDYWPEKKVGVKLQIRRDIQ